MIKLLLMGGLLFPTPQPIPVPKPAPIVFKVAPSKYDLSWIAGQGTAYYNGHDRMNGETGITASGYDLDNGKIFKGYRVLAGDQSFPLGTLIDIKLSNGEVINGVVLDRGGSVHGYHFDIVFDNLEDCLSFGRQEIQWQEVGRIDVR
jgi:3D (Asp-Asp-Asp) domain-containing protein